jgi:hypothetical protein
VAIQVNTGELIIATQEFTPSDENVKIKLSYHVFSQKGNIL